MLVDYLHGFGIDLFELFIKGRKAPVHVDYCTLPIRFHPGNGTNKFRERKAIIEGSLYFLRPMDFRYLAAAEKNFRVETVASTYLVKKIEELPFSCN